MAYIGQGIKQGTFKVLDTSGNTYNGSNTTFSLGTQVGSAAQLLVSHDGVIQKAGTDYTLATGGTQITFSTAPASGASIFITEISGAVGGTVTPSDTSVTADKLNSALLTGHTDIGGAIADADLFLVDDGAGGTLRKTAASRLKTYAGFSVSDITGATALTDIPALTDELLISDNGTLKRLDYSLVVPFAGCLLYKTGTQSNISQNSDVAITYDAEVFDTDGFHDNSTNNTRITIPSKFHGYKALFRGHAFLSDVDDTAGYEMRIFKNGASNADGAQLFQMTRNGSSNNVTISGVSHPVALGTDDYFELIISTDDNNVDIDNSGNGNNEVYFNAFSITIIPGSNI